MRAGLVLEFQTAELDEVDLEPSLSWTTSGVLGTISTLSATTAIANLTSHC